MADLRTLAIAALVELDRNPYELHAGRALAAAVLASPDLQSRAESAERERDGLRAMVDAAQSVLSAALAWHTHDEDQDAQPGCGCLDRLADAVEGYLAAQLDREGGERG